MGKMSEWNPGDKKLTEVRRGRPKLAEDNNEEQTEITDRVTWQKLTDGGKNETKCFGTESKTLRSGMRLAGSQSPLD